MRIISTFFVIITFIAAVASAAAQRSISDESRTLLDKGLDALGMVVQDCEMPPDFVSADPHRMPFHDSLFTRPLQAADEAHAYAGKVLSAGLYQKAMTDMGLGTFTRELYSMQVSAQELTAALGVDVSEALDQAETIIVHRMLEGVVTALKATQVERGRWAGQDIIIEMADSIWMSDSEDDGLSLFDSYEEERRARKRAEAFFDRANPEALAKVYCHGISLHEHLQAVIRDVLRNTDLTSSKIQTVIYDTDIGRIGIGGSGDDVYEGEFTVIIDLGGNDVYSLGERTKADMIRHPLHCIVDLGGNDVYVGGSMSLSSAFGGIGIVIDESGDDTYRVGSFTLGSALFGVAIHHDKKGNDSYLSGQNTQGSAAFGIGILMDDEGADLYQCHTQGQGFGATRGVGLLIDGAGNDQYIASSPILDVLRYEAHFVTFTQGASLGHRPIASGGIGILADHAGNDLYSTDIYGQGTAYWFGLGALVDMQGEDRYQAYQYAQGSGVHLATGILHDLDGDDVYASHGVSQGCGHDVALGLLVDEHGNDSYVVESLSLGGGNANAVSIFIDRAGSDSYIARNSSNTLGYSDFRRFQGMIGVFVDGGGADVYGETLRNDSVSVKSTYGVFMDVEIVTDTAPTQPPPTYVEMPLADDVDSLFIQASAAPLKYQNNVQPARDKLAAMDPNVIELLAAYFDTQMPRERLTLEYVLPRLREKDSSLVDGYLSRGLRSGNVVERTLCATVAGKAKAEAVIPDLIVLASDPSWKSRRLAALALGEIGHPSAVPTLRRLIADDHPWVRGRAGYALALCGGAEALMWCRPLFEDDDQIARNTAIEGIARGLKHSFKDVQAEIMRLRDPHYLFSAMMLIRAAYTTDADLEAFRQFTARATSVQITALVRCLPLLPEPYRDAYLNAQLTGKKRSKR